MLSLLGSFLLSVPVASTAPSAPAALAPLVAQDSIFGAPVVVHGRRITDDEIKRFLCHGIGSRDLDMFKFSVMVDQEIEKRKQAGATAEELKKLEVSDAELERRIQREREDFLLRYPTLDFPTEVARAEQSLELFRERLRATMRFDKVFRPENPAEWPEITKAIISENLTAQWIDDERVSYATRLRRHFDAQKEWMHANGFGDLLDSLNAIPVEASPMLVEAIADPRVGQALAKLTELGLGDIPADDPIAVEATRGTILQALNSYAIQYIDEDAIASALPPLGADGPSAPKARDAASRARAAKVLMLVEGSPIFTAQVWDRVAPFVPSDVIDDAKRFLAMQALLERDLAGKQVDGKPVLITPAEFREWWPTTAKAGKFGYMEYLQQHEMLSSQVLGFPSLWSFAQFIRVQESFKRSIADELAKDDMLAPSLPIINQIAGASKLNINVILVSAYDFDHVKWKDNGWENAKKRALDIKKALDEGADWTQTLEVSSEFWDPPMPEYGNKPMQNFYFKGTFANTPQTRNQLLGYLTESEFRIFLYGPSVTDHVFFEQKMGSIAGPFRGPKGYYISRITGKTPPSRPLDLKEPVHREIVLHHYLKNAMNARALALLNAGIDAGEIKGIAKTGGIKDL
ncbi:MAG: hypothetical protein IT454_16155 [Planctomycetes bacterium]|nr:hypothetical protein [Planctomycetota bacterium]